MSKKIRSALESLLAEGRNRFGEVLICRHGEKYVLTHYADANAWETLAPFTRAGDVHEISKYDAQGEFRPLKTAPDLKRGWALHLQTLGELHEALDFFYPAMLGVWVAHCEGRLTPVHFRETASRQSGMYDIVKKISDTQADELAADFCKSEGKCLKTILWKLDAGTPLTRLPARKFDPGADQLNQPCTGGNPMPLLCTEACNLFIAAARTVVRKPRGEQA